MEKPWIRALAVVAILLLGGAWVALGKHHAPSAATTVPDTASPSPAPKPAGDPAGEPPPASVPLPWANKASDSAPLIQFIKRHPSPIGSAIQQSFKADRAVVLVCIPRAPAPDPKLLAWVKECSDYCKSLATRIDIDTGDPKEKELLTFLKIDGLQPPFLASIALSGEVRGRLSGKMSRKRVIDLFAGVTGSCGVQCENGCD